MRLLNRLAVLSAFTVVNCASTAARSLQKLSLKDAEQVAIRNHPQMQASIDEVSAAQAQVTQARSAYFPNGLWKYDGGDSENTAV